MFLQQTLCYQVLKCGSSALLLLIPLKRRRNICLCHGDLLLHSIHGKQGFVASMALSEILAGFSSVSPISIRIENSLTLGLPEKIKCMHFLAIPQIYCPFVVFFWFFFNITIQVLRPILA